MTVIVQPAALPVSIEEARIAARVNGTDHDAELEVWVRSWTDTAEHITGRAFVERTHRITLNRFTGPIEAPQSPCLSVESIKYLDVDGAEQTVDQALYYLDSASAPAQIRLAFNAAWPETSPRAGAVTVEMVCGYGPDHTTTPAGAKGYILANLKQQFAPSGTPESPHLIRLLDPLKVYS